MANQIALHEERPEEKHSGKDGINSYWIAIGAGMGVTIGAGVGTSITAVSNGKKKDNP